MHREGGEGEREMIVTEQPNNRDPRNGHGHHVGHV